MSFGERIDEVSVVLHVEVYESVVVEIPVGPPRQRLSFLLVSLSTYHGRYIYNNHHQDNSRPDRTEKNPKGFFINSSYPSRSMEGFLREETKSAEEQRDCWTEQQEQSWTSKEDCTDWCLQWDRKRKIAELMILDVTRFDTLIQQILKEENVDRLNHQILSDRCGTILKSADYTQKRRLAIASGQLIWIYYILNNKLLLGNSVMLSIICYWIVINHILSIIHSITYDPGRSISFMIVCYQLYVTITNLY